jgi:hypothetical protein
MIFFLKKAKKDYQKTSITIYHQCLYCINLILITKLLEFYGSIESIVYFELGSGVFRIILIPFYDIFLLCLNMKLAPSSIK